ncbi:hypothetical protein ABEF95_011393 [Exophiala dermatitidis]
MSLQVCTRCRKKRIKCDLQLPACKMCRLADAECTFWDDTLDREIPGSYLYSLQQKARGLEAEIQQITDQDHATAAYEVNSVSPLEQDYHLTLADAEGLPSFSPAIYLGPGNAASFVKRLLTDMTTWHITNGSSLPKPLIPNDLSTLSSFQEPERIPSFPVTNDARKAELHSLLQPSTQRAVIEHYLKVVAPEYTLLPVERELGLLVHENPLKWTSSHRNDPTAISLNIVFAIATGLVARDLDFRLANVFMRSKEILQQTVLHDDPDTDILTATRWSCTALCALALCELICPTSGQVWDLLGRACSTLEDLREGIRLGHPNMDNDFRRLERVVLKLESKATTHFRRTSLFLGSQLTLYLRSIPPSDVLADELYVARCLHNISRVLATVSAPTETYLENLIPTFLQVTSLDSEISAHSATLYVALHPLFTHPDSFAGSGIFSNPSPRIIHLIAKSSAAMIDHFTKLNQRHMIISLWMAAERVLEAGAVWAAYLMHQRRASGRGPQGVAAMATDLAFAPIVKVSSLLASFAARWKPGSTYVDNWETLVELLWKMV